nr:hypothetical protein [Mesorhizobium sp.]
MANHGPEVKPALTPSWVRSIRPLSAKALLSVMSVLPRSMPTPSVKPGFTMTERPPAMPYWLRLSPETPPCAFSRVQTP